jgi:hypothetical protein
MRCRFAPIPVRQLIVQRAAQGQSASLIARCLGLVPPHGATAGAAPPQALYRQDGVRLGGSFALRVAVSGRAGQPGAVPGTGPPARGYLGDSRWFW